MNFIGKKSLLKRATFEELKSRTSTSALFQFFLMGFLFIFGKDLRQDITVLLVSLSIAACSITRFYLFNNSKRPLAFEIKNNIILSVFAMSWGVFLFRILDAKLVGSASYSLAYFVLAGLSSASLLSIGVSKSGFYIFNLILLLVPNLYFIQADKVEFEYYSMPVISLLYLVFLMKLQASIYSGWVKSQMSQAEMKEIIDSFPGGISVINKNKYSLINKWVIDSIGIGEKEILGRPVGYQDDESEFSQLVNHFSKSDKTQVSQTIFLKTKSGLRKHLVILKRLPFKEKEYVVASMDIHELVESQKLVEQQQAQLVESSKLATIGEMSSGLAHEISNPLSVIVNKGQVIQKELDKSEVDKDRIRAHVDRILKTTDRIFAIVKGLRNLARDTSHEDFQVFSLQQIISDSLVLSESKLKSSDVELFKSYSNEELLVECHPVQISQVLINVIGNACDAISDKSEKWIQFKVESDSENIYMTITDSGNGIPVDLRESILKPFFTTKGIGKGTGLGLSISSGIIEAHHGKFYFDHDAKNTTVKIVLPLRQPHEETLQAS